MKLSLPLALSLLFVTLTVGIGVGYTLSPVYQTTMFDKQSMGLGSADRWLDLRYLNAMATHHRGAILLAEQAQKQSTRPELQALAKDILSGEPKLIAELYAWKQAWYRDSRPAADPVVAKLGSADPGFDLRFLNALIAHHEAGIAMTGEVKTKSSTKEILNNADAVETFLTGSLVTLKNWRATWYQVQ